MHFRKLLKLQLIALLFLTFGFIQSNKFKWVGPWKKVKLLGTPQPPKSKATSYEEKLVLGRSLFFDPTLSKNKNIACASCHKPSNSFADNIRFSVGTNGETLPRNTPALTSLSGQVNFFLDGRATSLKEQLNDVLTNPKEMDMTIEELLNRINASSSYRSSFNSIYGTSSISYKQIEECILIYEKSLVSNSSKFDRFFAGDTNVFSNLEKLGLSLFVGKANCIECHKGPNFRDNEFHNIGIVTDDVGRQNIDKVGVKNEFEMTPYPFFATHKAFKTPSLRNVANTAPYFHNGSAKTLQDVIENYDKGGLSQDRTGIAKAIRPIGLSVKEKEALEAFLNTLSDE